MFYFKGQSYYFEQRLQILLWPSLVTSLSWNIDVLSTFSSELWKKLTYDLIINKTDPVINKSDLAKIHEHP